MYAREPKPSQKLGKTQPPHGLRQVVRRSQAPSPAGAEQAMTDHEAKPRPDQTLNKGQS